MSVFKGRYKKPRRHVRFRGPVLQTLKALAGVVQAEAYAQPVTVRPTQEERMATIRQHCPAVFKAVLGLPITLDHIEAEYKLDPNRILNRGDKNVRSGYGPRGCGEETAYDDVVRSAFMLAISGDTGLDPIRCFSTSQIAIAVDAQEGKCYYCGTVFSAACRPVGDHKHPHCRGGRTSQENCAAACRECNAEKSDMSSVEYIEMLRASAGEETRLW